MTLEKDIGCEIYKWAEDLFPICRSITGPGVRETLSYLSNIVPEIKIFSVPTGYEAFDWTVPNEWSVQTANISDMQGNVIVDFSKNNLHLVGYSQPVDTVMELAELEKHLFSLPDLPDAIPYVTSYYNQSWGFCITDNQRKKFKADKYRVHIDATLEPGVLNYGELIIPGTSHREILLSCYICHPSLANNELSGPVVTTALARWLQNLSSRYYTYRIIFIPETIGSIVYLSKHVEHLKKFVDAGLVITCVGDDDNYSFLPSRTGNTLIDRVALYVMKNFLKDFKTYSFLDRGSDERQYCSPLIDLPVASIMRTKYGEYAEYHTSLDDLSFISPKGLMGSFNLIQTVISCLEINRTYKAKVLCEPHLGKRNLYPKFSTTNRSEYLSSEILLDILAYCDGKTDLLEIAQIIEQPILKLKQSVDILLENGLIELINDQHV